MSFGFRRVVTGHDEQGRAIVRDDRVLEAQPRVAGFQGRDVWHTSAIPVSNDEADYDGGQASVVKGARTLIRVVEMPPGGSSEPIMHRSETLDYAIVLSGECDMALDGGEVVHLQTGDVVVQRGTNHAWINNGPQPCRFLFVLIDAEPVRVGVQLLGEFLDNFPAGHHVMPAE